MAAVLGVVLLSACEAALDVRLVLDRDGGGRLAVSLSADRELLARAEEAGTDPLAALAAAGRQLDGWEVTEEPSPAAGRASAGRRVELVTAVAGPQELQARSAELAEALSAPEVDLLDGFAVTVDDHSLTVEGRAGLVPTEVTTEVGLRPEDAVRLLQEHDAFRYTVRVRLPAAVRRSNATTTPAEGESGDLVWVIEPGESVPIAAVGERPARWSLLADARLLVGAGVTAGLLLMSVGGLLVRRRAR